MAVALLGLASPADSTWSMRAGCIGAVNAATAKGSHQPAAGMLVYLHATNMAHDVAVCPAHLVQAFLAAILHDDAGRVAARPQVLADCREPSMARQECEDGSVGSGGQGGKAGGQAWADEQTERGGKALEGNTHTRGTTHRWGAAVWP